MKPLKVACIGEAMVELSLDANDTSTANVGFAGDTLNTAIYLKRSAGADLSVSYVTRLGEDAFSESLLRFIQAEDIRTDKISTSATKSPGLYAITTDEAGERSFAYWRDTSAARELFQNEGTLDFSMLEEFDVLFVSAITLAILPDFVCSALLNWIRNWRTRTKGRFVFDSNYRPKLWADKETAQNFIQKAWGICDIALPTVDDEIDIFGDPSQDAVIARLKNLGVTTGALKCGASGPVSLSGAKYDLTFEPAQNVVDTTAAGDSFNGGYLAELLVSGDEQRAMRAGHTLASKVVGTKGAILPKGH